VRGKFKVLSMREKHDLFLRVNMDNMVTVPGDEGIEYREDRPLVLLTSTSYTPDEDLGILLKALEEYVKIGMSNDSLPHLYLVVTGNGPLKSKYLQEFDKFNEYLGHGIV
jgi:hypothetical protein